MTDTKCADCGHVKSIHAEFDSMLNGMCYVDGCVCKLFIEPVRNEK